MRPFRAARRLDFDTKPDDATMNIERVVFAETRRVCNIVRRAFAYGEMRNWWQAHQASLRELHR
jgi:hypothetical protein